MGCRRNVTRFKFGCRAFDGNCDSQLSFREWQVDCAVLYHAVCCSSKYCITEQVGFYLLLLLPDQVEGKASSVSQEDFNLLALYSAEISTVFPLLGLGLMPSYI